MIDRLDRSLGKIKRKAINAFNRQPEKVKEVEGIIGSVSLAVALSVIGKDLEMSWPATVGALLSGLMGLSLYGKVLADLGVEAYKEVSKAKRS